MAAGPGYSAITVSAITPLGAHIGDLEKEAALASNCP
jgi:hypothetical protein